MRRARPLALVLGLLTAGVFAQAPATRRAVSLATLIAYPSFYHLRPVVVVGTVSHDDRGEAHLSDDAGLVRVLFKGNIPDGTDEVRGEFWDLGRLSADDPHLAGYNPETTFHIDPSSPWPSPGQVLVLAATAVEQAQTPLAPSIRSLVLFPSRYLGQTVTVTGEFAGRNLLGNLPDAPARSRYDFVLRSADAAIWVANIKPQGKDFDLSLDTRVDTNRWVEVSGTLQEGHGLLWLEGTPNSLRLTQAPAEQDVSAPARPTLGPPPEVLFSVPVDDESDVALSTSVRIQFTRDIDPATIKGHVEVKYDPSESAIRGEPDTPVAEFTTEYAPGSRILQIHFTSDLERFRTLRVHLDEGILGTDKQPLKPWTLTFHTGP